MIEKVYDDPAAGKVVFRKSPRCRRIGIRVHPVRGVTVSVPWMMRMEDGMRFYMQKRDWVISVIERQAGQNRQKELLGFAVGDLSSGSTFNTLISRIEFSCNDEADVREVTVTTVPVEDVHDTGRLFLDLSLPLYLRTVSFPARLHEGDVSGPSRLLSDVLSGILRKEAKSLLPEKLAFLAGRYGFVYNKVTIKHNSSNWGSCSSKGNINLNLNLVRLPELLCDYVLLHELCHLRHPDHGRMFHTLLEQLCADNLRRRQAVVEKFAGTPAGSGFRDSWTQELLLAVSRSRSVFPVHSTMEKQIKKYRLI